jgi:hypothetical protein
MRGQLSNVEDIKRALMGGKSTLTLVSKSTGTRYTFRFNRPPGDDPQRVVWVKALVGADNETSYKYLGAYWPKDQAFRPKGAEPSSRAVAWMLAILRDKPDSLLSQAEVWHEGTCARCGRKLTVPESIASGFGPECRSKSSNGV